MTAKQAKNLCIKLWKYLKNHPSIDTKTDLPHQLYDQIHTYTNMCPLCEFFEEGCTGCPLKKNGCMPEGSYAKWSAAPTDELRAKYANEIIEKVTAWEV